MDEVVERRARSRLYWDASAPGWVAHADEQDRFGEPMGRSAVEWLALRPGESVVDVGCGCGGTTAELAALVGSAGRCLGVDFADAMVVAARQRFPQLSFTVADIETVGTLPGAPYDAAFSRMVLMLLSDPVAGCGTLRRSLRAGGRLAATTFRALGSTPWLSAVMLGAAPHVGPLPAMPIEDEPGPFAFADAAHARGVLEAAGFVDVGVEAVDVTLTPDGPAHDVMEWLIEVGPAGPAYRAAGVAGRTAARAGATQLLRRFRSGDGGYRLPTGLWLLTGWAPT